MGAAEKIDIAGKDWLTVEEAAHYCGVSDSQFRKNANTYGLQPKRFMGKQLYAKSDLYAAIKGAESWLTSSHSTGEARVRTSIGTRVASDSGAASANLQPVRLRKFVPRKRQS